MARASSKKAVKKKKAEPTFKPRNARPMPLQGLAFFILAIFTLLSLITYDWQQNTAFTTEPESLPMGNAGMWVGYNGLRVLGNAFWLIPLFCLWFAGMYTFAQAYKVKFLRIVSIFFSILFLTIISSLQEVYFSDVSYQELAESRTNNNLPYGPGGFVGDQLYRGFLHESIGILGTLVIFGLLFLAALFHIFHDNIGIWILRRFRGYREWKARRNERKALKLEEKARLQKDKEAVKGITPEKKEKPSLKSSEKADILSSKNADRDYIDAPPPPPKKIPGSTPVPDLTLQPQEEPPVEPDEETPKENPKQNLKIIASETTRKASKPLPEKKGDYQFPSLDLLSEPPPEETGESDSVHQETADVLVRTLGEFGVKVTMGDVHAGPVITRYDVYPAAGVRVEKIANLDKNIALGLKANSVRILAPVPGLGCVGIEIPNKKPLPVYVRDILESEDWVNNEAEIPIALGKEVSGKPLITDLTRMPHLLIAGATGSGKTVCINTIITSLLYKHSPEDLRFVMVDPKIVEMQVYNTLPHMLIPVVTEPKKVPGALRYLATEMENRYQMFAAVGVRNIAGFNARKNRSKEAEERAKELDASLSPEERAAAASVEVPRDINNDVPDKLPYIVCIVDELADLMMVAPQDIETGIARLAQLARAAGIHLILATQRPSVNVITGVIKANLPSRIAFKVASKVDSRTILDIMGADHLIGRGDMLFLPPGSGDLIRSQGAFVADEEINQVVDFITRNNGEPVFDEQFQKNVEESVLDGEGNEDDTEWDDDLVPQALEVLRTSQRASTSMLQRRLKIGYNRAARIMEMLEAEGIVGPENGSNPREILKDLNDL